MPASLFPTFLCSPFFDMLGRTSTLASHSPGSTQVVLMVKNLPANAEDERDTGLIPGWGRSPGGRNGTPLQYSCLESPTDRGAWQATVHGVTKSRTWLSNYAWTLAWFSGFPLLLTRCKYWPDVLLMLCEPQFPCLHSGEDMACLSGLLWYLSKITYVCVTHRRSSIHSLPPHPFTGVHTNVFLCTCESAVIRIFKITQHELCDMRDRLSPREEA